MMHQLINQHIFKIAIVGFIALMTVASCTKKQSDELQSPFTSNVGSELDANEMIEGEHKALVFAQCSGCHSIKLVIQNRASRTGWKNMIEWMQETQNLWDLGTNEDKILDYLSTNYGPKDTGRRANLKVDEWYELQ